MTQKPINTLITLLAIDDEPHVLELISEALQQEGLEIIIADEPEAGLKLFFERRPRVVITDFMMPKLNGMEILQKIVATDPESRSFS